MKPGFKINSCNSALPITVRTEEIYSWEKRSKAEFLYVPL